MPGVRIQITRFHDDWQPGFVACELTDVDGRCWSFEEKVPVVSKEYLDSTSVYPHPGVIGCVVLFRGEDRVRIEVEALNDWFACEVRASEIVEW